MRLSFEEAHYNISKMKLGYLLVLSIVFSVCNGYNILFLAARMGKSHFMFMSSIVHGLLQRGHNVTFLTVHSLGDLNSANYTEILVDFTPTDTTKESGRFVQEGLIQWIDETSFSWINSMFSITTIFNEQVFNSSNVKKFVSSSSSENHYDLIILEEFFADSFLMFAHKYKAPIITICSYGVSHTIDRQHGLLSPPSFVPFYLMPYSDDMSFSERWHNTLIVLYDWFVHNFIYLPSEEATAKKSFKQFAPLPSVNDLKYNVSLTLVNSHRALSPPRPSMSNVIPIGGAHIKPNNPLPNDIQTFLDEAQHGAIYFSFGTVLQFAQMSSHLVQSFIGSFKNIKQRVILKFDNATSPDIPSNVMIRKWIPQNDVLAHPNIVLFISHGGLFGTTESLYHGVPLLMVPFFGDQFRNAHRIYKSGHGHYVNHREITADSFTKAINHIISNESYRLNARKASAVLKDNIIHPLDEAMFWIEHVAKFKGAKHLKSHAVNLSWFTYLCLDIILVTLAILIIAFQILKTALKILFKQMKSEENLTKKQN